MRSAHFKNMTDKTIRLTIETTESVLEAFNNGGKGVVLTPDDILTLRLLRDGWLRERMANNTNNRLNPGLDKGLETLERILKQVE